MRARSEPEGIVHDARLALVGIRPAPKPKRNHRPRPPQSKRSAVRTPAQPATVHATLGKLNQALWREDWQSVQRLEHQLDVAVLGKPWRPDV